MTTPLGDLARVLALDACGTVLDSFPKLPSAAPLDAALEQPPATDAPTALAQLVRRGFDSSLVALVRGAWSADVVARGLLAWDVLNGSIVERGEARSQLQADARAVRAVLPRPGQAFVKVDRRRGAPLPGGDGGPRIAPIMRALGGSAIDPRDVSPEALERARNFGRILHRSHLTTMASFYLADLVFQHRHLPALPDLVEVLLDAGAEEVEQLVVPDVEPDTTVDDATIELGTYARVRTKINAGHARQCLDYAAKHRQIFTALKLNGDKAAAINPRPTLAYAEAALRCDVPTVDADIIEALTRLEMPWRYAFYVATLYGAVNTKSRHYLAALGTYLQSFGNHAELWYQVGRAMPEGAAWAAGLLALLVRELERLPHDVQAWRGAAMIFGAGDAATRADEECAARLAEQATLS